MKHNRKLKRHNKQNKTHNKNKNKNNLLGNYKTVTWNINNALKWDKAAYKGLTNIF